MSKSISFEAELRSLLPHLRGNLTSSQPLAPYSWFRVGGPAQILFSPTDEQDLIYFLKNCPLSVTLTPLGLGSNVIVRDGGIEGVVIRLSARGFGGVEVLEDCQIRAGAAVPDMKLSKIAADAAIAGFEFYRGIPGSVGGALVMNAGAHDGQTDERLVEVRGISRQGEPVIFSTKDLGYGYRVSHVPSDTILTGALFRGTPGDTAAIFSKMDRIMEAREAAQPIREKTGGSTFKNPPNGKAWYLIDAAGCRGLVVGDAEVSILHCNFLINRGHASAADIENLGEEVRKKVKSHSGIDLEWEIKRLGQF